MTTANCSGLCDAGRYGIGVPPSRRLQRQLVLDPGSTSSNCSGYVHSDSGSCLRHRLRLVPLFSTMV